jgi:hypothetical protein
MAPGNASEDLRVTTGGSKRVHRESYGVHSWSIDLATGITWPKEADQFPMARDLWFDLRRIVRSSRGPLQLARFGFRHRRFGDMGGHILNWPFTALTSAHQ